jgi:biotin transport system substrate-specific component
MANADPGTIRPVLADRLRSHGLATDAALIAGAVVFTGVMAQVAVPMWPVPITGQTLAVVLVGATLGARRGALAMALYVLVGLAGAPVFASLSGGLHSLAVPSFGYVLGFAPSAAAIGWLARRDWDRRFLRAAIGFTLASTIPFLTGIPYLAIALGQLGLPNDIGTVLGAGLYPFVVGGLAKALIAAGLLPIAWRALAGSRHR